MLNPPLSILPPEALLYVVDHVAALSSAKKDLQALCLTDRVFTYACQKWIYRNLRLDGGNEISLDEQLQRKGKILAKAPLLSRWIRNIQLSNMNNRLFWLLSDPRFVSILQMLALSPRPPNELGISGYDSSWPVLFDDSHFFTTRLSQSFFPRTLTTLRLWKCQDVPLIIIAMLPLLKQLDMDFVAAGNQGYSRHDWELLTGQHLPALEVLESRESHTMLSRMAVPFSHGVEAVVRWDKLRVLQLPPHDRESMQCLPRILSLARDSLEELYLDDMYTKTSLQLPLAELIDLSNLPELRVFTLRCELGSYDHIADISTILRRIPTKNKVGNIMIHFPVINASILHFNYRWKQLCGEAKRISTQRRVEFELQIFPASFFTPGAAVERQVKKLRRAVSSLLADSKVCLHVWSPSSWALKIPPTSSGTYRAHCTK